MPRIIHCPNCEFEGDAKDENQGCLQLIVVMLFFIISCFFWPLFLVTAIIFVYFLFQGKKMVCPKCAWKNPIPIDQWKTIEARKKKD